MSRGASPSAATTASDAIPILLYHSVGTTPSPWIAPFTVAPAVFEAHMDLVVESGRTPLTISELVDGLRDVRPLPERPVVVTFDDGFADLATAAVPAMTSRAISSTVYVTTGFLDGPGRVAGAPSDAMLAWSQLAELAAAGVEVGGHTHSHPQLDTLPVGAAEAEMAASKDRLEDALGRPVRSFAYPHGYSSPAVRRRVADLGYDSACSVKNALSSRRDDPFSLARLMVMATTTMAEMRAWLQGSDAPVAPFRESVRTRCWRSYRRARAVAAGRR